MQNGVIVKNNSNYFIFYYFNFILMLFLLHFLPNFYQFLYYINFIYFHGEIDKLFCVKL